jgi:hypothetical protein
MLISGGAKVIQTRVSAIDAFTSKVAGIEALQ